MCGIVGVISRRNNGLYGNDLDLFEQALVIDTLRGKDSTGAFTGLRNKQAKAIKHGSVPHEMFKTKQWNEFRGDAVSSGKFVIGHNRAATRGEVSTDNAHPFVEENIILVHNGTLWGNNEKELTDKAVAVDSNSIAHALVVEKPEVVIPKIKGAFALIWFNTETQKLHMIRNEERPLWLLVTPDIYMVASEPWMIASPYQRQGGRQKIGQCVEIEPGDLYTFDEKGMLDIKEIELRPKAQAVKSTATTGGNTTAGNDQNFFGKGNSEPETGTPESTTLRKAMEAVEAAHSQQVKTSVTNNSKICALVIPRDTDTTTVTSTLTTESDSTKNLTEPNAIDSSMSEKSTSEKSEQMSVVPYTRNGEFQTNEQKQTNTSEWAGPTQTPAPSKSDREMKANLKNIVDTPLYPVGRVVLFRLLSKTTDYRGSIRWDGHLMEPGMELAKVRGIYEKHDDSIPVGAMCTGIIYFTTISVHGPEIYISNAHPCEYTRVHGKNMVPKHLWSIAYKEQHCDECGGEILLHDKGFTAVSHKAIFGKTRSGHPLNVIQVLCANCVEKKLPEGEYLESFKARRRNIQEAIAHARTKVANASAYSSVQEGESGRSVAGSQPNSIILLPGASTIH